MKPLGRFSGCRGFGNIDFAIFVYLDVSLEHLLYIVCRTHQQQLQRVSKHACAAAGEGTAVGWQGAEDGRSSIKLMS